MNERNENVIEEREPQVDLSFDKLSKEVYLEITAQREEMKEMVNWVKKISSVDIDSMLSGMPLIKSIQDSILKCNEMLLRLALAQRKGLSKKDLKNEEKEIGLSREERQKLSQILKAQL